MAWALARVPLGCVNSWQAAVVGVCVRGRNHIWIHEAERDCVSSSLAFYNNGIARTCQSPRRTALILSRTHP